MSSLTGDTAKSLCEAYTKANNRPWTQPIRFKHALFKVVIDVLIRAKALEPKPILDAIVTTNAHTIVGPVAWG